LNQEKDGYRLEENRKILDIAGEQSSMFFSHRNEKTLMTVRKEEVLSFIETGK